MSISTRIIPPLPSTVTGVGGTSVKHTVSTVDPNALNDNTEGYEPLSRWVNTTNLKHYVCVNATTSAAVWIDTTAGGGGGGSSDTWNVVDIEASSFTYTTASRYTLITAPTADSNLLDSFELYRNGVADQTRVSVSPASPGEYQVIGNILLIFGDITSSGDLYRFRYIS